MSRSDAGVADGHVNLKSSGDRVFAAVKTNNDTGTNPLVVLLQRSATGTWTNRTAWIGSTNVTRPIVQINATAGTARLFATGPPTGGGSGENGEQIVTKDVALDTGSFAAGAGTVVMGRDGAKINNVTGSKAPVTDTTGLVVLAADGMTKRYWHHRSPALVVPGAPATPTVVGGDRQVTVSWTAPANAGPPITGYVVTPYIGGAPQTPKLVAPTPTNTVFTGLTNGTAYTFKVAAVNTAGTGPQSPASAAVTRAPVGPVGSVYVAINPCRVLDTRAPAATRKAFIGNEERNYRVGGTGPEFAGQGGRAGGCAIPDSAKAVEASVTATTPNGTAYTSGPRGQRHPTPRSWTTPTARASPTPAPSPSGRPTRRI